MSGTDMVDGLALLDQWRNNSIYSLFAAILPALLRSLVGSRCGQLHIPVGQKPHNNIVFEADSV
jgi:hypothetical protein